jgi:hypothetical protein
MASVFDNILIPLPGSRISATYFKFSNLKHIIKRKNNAKYAIGIQLEWYTTAAQGYLEAI